MEHLWPVMADLEERKAWYRGTRRAPRFCSCTVRKRESEKKLLSLRTEETEVKEGKGAPGPTPPTGELSTPKPLISAKICTRDF